MPYVTKRLGALLDAVAADAGVPALTTAPQECHGASRFRWTASIDWTAATAVTIQVYTSLDGGTLYGLMQSQAIAAGTATLNDYTQSNACTGDESFDGWVDVGGCTHVYAIMAAPSGGSGDLLTFKAALAQLKR